eukprot:Nk52_evm40s248 gene=Nk52_evmTU40s248
MGKTKVDKKEKSSKKEKSASPSKEKSPKKSSSEEKPEMDYDELVTRVNEISKPLAPKKLSKKILKTVKKAAKNKSLRRGVKEVVKGLRKGEKGVCVIAGDISPIDVISHVPILCEDHDVPYCFVPSKEELGCAGATKRPTSCVMVKSHSDIKESYDECLAEVKKLPVTVLA